MWIDGKDYGPPCSVSLSRDHDHEVQIESASRRASWHLVSTTRDYWRILAEGCLPPVLLVAAVTTIFPGNWGGGHAGPGLGALLVLAAGIPSAVLVVDGFHEGAYDRLVPGTIRWTADGTMHPKPGDVVDVPDQLPVR